MFAILITDCQDPNALTRVGVRLSSLLDYHTFTIGVDNDLEAAGNLIDSLDASLGGEGVVVVNVAPRHKEGKKWENGTPFGYFFFKKTLVISSIDGLTLSLVKKLKLADKIFLLDIPKVLHSLEAKGVVDEVYINHVKMTQFRSFEFLPRLAKWLKEGLYIPNEVHSLKNGEAIPSAIWWIDNFGNCKTTLFAHDLDFKAGSKIKTNFGEFTLYERLKSVPDGEAAIIIGSSGIEERRFLEIVIQGGSAAKTYKIKTKDPLKIYP